MSAAVESGRTALIIGDTGLIGVALGRALVREDWRVEGASRGPASAACQWPHWVIDASYEPSLTSFLEKLNAESIQLDLLALAIGNECDVEDFGTKGGASRLNEVTTMALAAPLMALQALLPLMKNGSLAVFYSGGGALSAPKGGWNVSYAAAKAGLHRAVESLAIQLRSRGVWPVIVDPGWVPKPSEMLEFEDGVETESGLSEAFLRRPEDSAEAVMYAFDRRSEAVAGRLISVLRDYRSDINAMTVDSDFTFLRLRLTPT